MKNSYVHTILLMLATFVLAACNLRVVRGSGDVISKLYPVSSFNHITLSGSGDVIITQGGEESLRVETDDNVMEYIKADVKDGTLHIGFEDRFNMISTTHLIFHVGVDDLSGMTILGSGNIETERLEADNMQVGIYGNGTVRIADMAIGNFETNIFGTGKIWLAGEVGTQDIMINGFGEYLAGKVCSEQVSVMVNGFGDATICALNRVEAIISGTGSVNYYDQPTVDFSGFGTGRLISLGDS